MDSNYKKYFDDTNYARIVLVGVALIIVFFLYKHLKITPVRVLHDHLEHFSSFESSLSALSFISSSEVQIENFELYEDEKMLITMPSTPWKTVKSKFTWSSQENTISVGNFSLSPQEAHDSFFFLSPSLILAQLESGNYELREYGDADVLYTNISIPLADISNDIYESYRKGADIVSDRKAELAGSCFLGWVEDMGVQRMEKKGVLTGELVFSIRHKGWALSAVSLSSPLSMTTYFTGKLCDSDTEVTGHHTSASQNMSITFTDITPKE